jgi:hypothetical protein
LVQQVSTTLVVPFAAAIAMAGPRCAVDVGNNLQLGVEIMNETRRWLPRGAARLVQGRLLQRWPDWYHRARQLP